MLLEDLPNTGYVVVPAGLLKEAADQALDSTDLKLASKVARLTLAAVPYKEPQK